MVSENIVALSGTLLKLCFFPKENLDSVSESIFQAYKSALEFMKFGNWHITSLNARQVTNFKSKRISLAHPIAK